MKNFEKKFERVLRIYDQVALGDPLEVGSLRSPKNALCGDVPFLDVFMFDFGSMCGEGDFLKLFINLLNFLKNFSCSAHINKTYKNVKKYKKVLCNFFCKILA